MNTRNSLSKVIMVMLVPLLLAACSSNKKDLGDSDGMMIGQDSMGNDGTMMSDGTESFDGNTIGSVDGSAVPGSQQDLVNNAGDLVFTVIPKNHNGFIVKAKVPSFNSGKMKIGQRVNIKLQNYPETEYGMLVGKLTSISSIPDKDGSYFVDVSLPNKLMTTYNKEVS